MNRLAPLVIVVLIVAVATTASAAPSGPPPSIAQLKQRINNLRSDKADLQDQVAAQDQVISDQADTIQRLRDRIANTPPPLDAILNRDPDGLWAAMRAIWLAFPTQDPSQICGYDRSNAPGDGIGLNVTSFSFYRTTGC